MNEVAEKLHRCRRGGNSCDALASHYTSLQSSRNAIAKEAQQLDFNAIMEARDAKSKAEAAEQRAKREAEGQANAEAFAKAREAREVEEREERRPNLKECLGENPGLLPEIRAGKYSLQLADEFREPNGTGHRVWKWLTLTVDDHGCGTWEGTSGASVDAHGRQPGGSSTCVETGESRFYKDGTKLLMGMTRISVLSTGQQPNRFAMWRCGRSTIQTPLQVTLPGCLRIGSEPAREDERMAEILCNATHPFEELDEKTVQVQRDGSIRVPLSAGTKTQATLKLETGSP